MKSIVNYIIIAVIATVLFTACEKTEKVEIILDSNLEVTENHPKSIQYQQIIEELLAVGVPGVSVTVRSPEGIWSEAGGKADLSHNIDLSPGHSLRAGSMSKTFAATTILILQDEGILSIDDKINKYIPHSITDKIENAYDVSIKQILNMTSGIRDYSDLRSVLGILNLSSVKLSAEENLKIIYNKPANFSPGERNLYTNANYLLTALVIKYATGKTANEVVQEKIIDRFELSNTYISTAQPDNLSRSYIDLYDNGYIQDVTEIDNNAVGGEDMLDGGIISSSYDLSKFLELLMHGEILTENSLNQMKEFRGLTELVEDMEYIKGYGLGLMQLETANGIAVGHYGNVHGFTGLMFYFPEDDITLSIMVNGHSTKMQEVLEREGIFNHLF